MMRDRVDVVSTRGVRFEHALLEFLVLEDSLKSELQVVKLEQSQRALVWIEGRLRWMLGPGTHAFWNTPFRVEVEVFDVDTLRFEHPRVDAIVEHSDASQWLRGIEVDAGADRDEALRRTIRDVGGACILTSVTTGLGFLSLMVVPAATLRHVALASSIGVAGVPSASLVAIAIILGAIGLPVEAIGILMVFDRILDMCRTAINIWGDCVCATIVARLEGEETNVAA